MIDVIDILVSIEIYPIQPGNHGSVKCSYPMYVHSVTGVNISKIIQNVDTNVNETIIFNELIAMMGNREYQIPKMMLSIRLRL